MARTRASRSTAETEIVTETVKYVGTADVREIDAAAWRRSGVEDQGKVVWNKRNGWTVPASEFSEDALNWISENQPELVISGVSMPEEEEADPDGEGDA